MLEEILLFHREVDGGYHTVAGGVDYVSCDGLRKDVVMIVLSFFLLSPEPEQYSAAAVTSVTAVTQTN